MKDIIYLTNLTTAFSVRFCDNLLLVLKMRFQVFSFASKTLHSFSSARKILRETRNSFKKWPLNSWRISSETIVEVKNVTKDCYFCDCNWTRTQNHLVLKRTLNHLAKLVFLLSYKNTQSLFLWHCFLIFPWARHYLMILGVTQKYELRVSFNVIAIVALSSTQFFEILFFSQDVWGNVHYVREINLISLRPLIKSL